MALEGFESFRFSHDGTTRDVYRRGSGPGVVVVHEIPGITPPVAHFGRRVADAGFTAYLPHLFGTPNKPLSAGYALGQMARACISREFRVLAKHESSPITDWLRALCRKAHADCGGPGVGAGCKVLGLRFTADPMCPGERFDTLRRELGDGFEAIEIDSSRGNPHGIKRIAHSVVTNDLVDEEGHPTRQALDRVLGFYRERLLPAT